MTNTVNEMDYAILDPAIDYIDTFDEVYSETVYENYDALSTTSNTTPEFNSPDAKELQSHFSYLNNYDYKPFKHVKSSSFSLPDKLNTLNISQASSKSPTPEFIYNNQEIFDSATINPQDIFTLTQEKSATKKDSIPPVEIESIKPPENFDLPKNYILPSSSSSPNLSSIFNQYNKDVDFKMNNECFNAIKVWLNNNELNDELNNETLVNPTGIIKTNQVSKRRNSIQMINNALPVSSIDKRKRRKSTNSNSNLTEFKSLLLNNELNEDTTKKNNNNKLKSPEENGRNSSQLIDREEVLRQTIQSINFSQLEEEGKPFPCPDCNKQFKRSEHLKRHIRSVHSNIRPFHCKYCEKQFSRSDNLAQHLKTHYKLNSNGTTLIIYGNPNLHNRGGRRKNSSSGKRGDYIEEGTGTV